MEVATTTAMTLMEVTLVLVIMATNLTLMDTHVMVRCIFSSNYRKVVNKTSYSKPRLLTVD